MSIILKIFNIKFIVFFSILLAAVLIPMIIFFSRSPVLIVAEESFPDFYGKDRIKKESFASSLVLFRPVKTVFVADEAGDDIVSLAVNEVSKNPFCVFFPLRYARAAKLYREQNPHIHIVLLEGRFAEDSNPSSFAVSDDLSGYFVYKTNITEEFYKAGLTAAAIHYFYEPENRVLDRTQTGDIAVFLGTDMPQIKETFSKAFADFEEANRKQIKNFRKLIKKEKEKREKELEKRGGKNIHPSESKTDKAGDTQGGNEKTGSEKGKIEENISAFQETENEDENENIALPNIQFCTSLSQYTEKPNLSCVVMVDTAVEFFDRNAKIPVIYFSWLNPEFLPGDVVVIVNDSPWIQAVSAVRMVLAGEEKGLISSKFFLSGAKKFDKRTLRKIRKTW